MRCGALAASRWAIMPPIDDADHVGALDAQRVEHAERVVRHVLQACRRSAPAGRCAAARSARSGCRLPASSKPWLRPMSRLSWRTTRKPASTSACTKSSGQAISCMPRPMISSTTGRALAAAVLDLDLDAVGCDLHRFHCQMNSRSRSHLVATHFSPASTGAPPCSVRVAGSGRS